MLTRRNADGVGWARAKASHHLLAPSQAVCPSALLSSSHISPGPGQQSTHSILGLEETLLLPPWVPGSFHILRAVGVGHGATDIWGRDGEGAASETGSSRGGLCKSSKAKWKQGQCRKGQCQRQQQLRRGGSLPSSHTFLFPSWGWEVICNDPRIPFSPLLWFWFLLLGREKIRGREVIHPLGHQPSSFPRSFSPLLAVAAAVVSSASAGISLASPVSLPPF